MRHVSTIGLDLAKRVFQVHGADISIGNCYGANCCDPPRSSSIDSAGGDKEGQVAVTKGKANSIKSTMKSKNCK